MIYIIFFMLSFISYTQQLFNIEKANLKEIWEHQQTVAEKLKKELFTKIKYIEKQFDVVQPTQEVAQMRKNLNNYVNNIEQIIINLLSKLRAIYQKYQYKKGTAIKHIVYNQMQDEINQFYNKMSIDLAHVATFLQSQQDLQKQHIYQENLVQAAQHKKEIINQLHDFQTFIVQIKTIKDDARMKFLEYASTGKLSVESIMPMMNRYQALAQVSNKKNQLFNIQRIVYSQFTSFVLSDLAISNNTIQRLFEGYLKKTNTMQPFFTLLHLMPERFIGDNGYMQAEKTLFKILDDNDLKVERKKFYDQLSFAYVQFVKYGLSHAAKNAQADKQFYKEINDLYASGITLLSYNSIHQSKIIQGLHEQMGYVAAAWIKKYLQGDFGNQSEKEIELTLIKLYQDATNYFTQAQQGATNYFAQKHNQANALKYKNNIIVLQAGFNKLQKAHIQGQQGNELAAQELYQDAQKIFQQIGADRLAQKLVVPQKAALEKKETDFSKILVKEFQENILPQGATEKVANMQIPVNYVLAKFSQQVPQEAISFINKKDEELLDLALYMQASRSVGVYGIRSSDIFDTHLHVKSSYAVDETKKDLVKTIITYGQQLKDMLAQRIKAGKTKLYIQDAPSYSLVQGKELVITNYPIFPSVPVEESPLSQTPYPGYPTAQSYFLWIGQLADPHSKPMAYGNQEIVSANMPEVVNKMKKEQIKTLLSAANQVQKRINYIMHQTPLDDIDETINTTEKNILNNAQATIKKIKQVNKDDFSQKLSTYLPTYIALKSYIDDAMITYYVGANDLFKEDEQAQKEINRLESQAYEQLAHIAQIFLIGNPQDALYLTGMGANINGILADVIKYYRLAINLTPEKQEKLLSSMLHSVMHAGDLLVKENKSFAALRYYQIALGIIIGMKVQNKNEYQNIIRTFLKYTYKAALTYLAQFRISFINPITITYDHGISKKITLDELTKRIITCPEPKINKYECHAYENARVALLDSLIYFQDVNNWIDIIIKNKTAPNQLLQNFIKSYNFSYETISGMTNLLKNNQFTIIVQKALDIFEKNNAQPAKRNDSLSFFKQWNKKLFDGLINIYTTLFLKGAENFKERMNDVLQLLKFERTSIMSPVEQWI